MRSVAPKIRASGTMNTEVSIVMVNPTTASSAIDWVNTRSVWWVSPCPVRMEAVVAVPTPTIRLKAEKRVNTGRATFRAARPSLPTAAPTKNTSAMQ